MKVMYQSDVDTQVLHVYSLRLGDHVNWVGGLKEEWERAEEWGYTSILGENNGQWELSLAAMPLCCVPFLLRMRYTMA